MTLLHLALGALGLLVAAVYGFRFLEWAEERWLAP